MATIPVDSHKADALKRMKSISGHVKGIERMLTEDEYCIYVIKQIQAVQAALNKVTTVLLDGHLHSCVTTAVQSRNVAERERVLQEIAQVFDAATKV